MDSMMSDVRFSDDLIVVPAHRIFDIVVRPTPKDRWPSPQEAQEPDW